jgi:nucleotide-binding universal stress UspA family protein
MRFRNILVATDFSECSARAVETGSAMAAWFGAELHLLHVVTAPMQEALTAFSPDADALAEAEVYKAAANRRLVAIAAECGSTLRRVEVATGLGVPADEILAYAQAYSVDLIVCGTHGRRGVERLLLGSVAERVARLSDCPVLTIAAGRPAGATAAA